MLRKSVPEENHVKRNIGIIVFVDRPFLMQQKEELSKTRRALETGFLAFSIQSHLQITVN